LMHGARSIERIIKIPNGIIYAFNNSMNKKEIIPVIGVSLLLVSYPVLIFFQIWLPVFYLIYIISFILVVWLIYNVLYYGEYKRRELEKDEKWGYVDTDKPHSLMGDK